VAVFREAVRLVTVRQIVNTAYITCHLQQENSLSLIVSDLSTNCRAYLLRLTDSKTLLIVIL